MAKSPSPVRVADQTPSTVIGTKVVRWYPTAYATAWLAPSRADFERLGLVHFPIFLRFDAEGRLQEVRMGDAAPKEPGF